MAKEVKPTEVHLTDDEVRKAKEGIAVARYYASGRGNYDGTGGKNTTVSGDMINPPDDTELPRVCCGVSAAEIHYGNRTFCNVPLIAAEALQMIIEAFPSPIGLNAKMGPHPERAIDKLPEMLRAHIEAVPSKGHRFTL